MMEQSTTKQQQKKSSKKLVFIIIGIVTAVVLLFVIIFALAFQATNALVTPVEQHFALIRQGDVQGAYNLTSEGFQSVTSFDDYQTIIVQTPIFAQVKAVDFSNRQIEDNIGILIGNIVFDDGTTLPMLFEVIQENNDWKILYFETNPDLSEY